MVSVSRHAALSLRQHLCKLTRPCDRFCSNRSRSSRFNPIKRVTSRTHSTELACRLVHQLLVARRARISLVLSTVSICRAQIVAGVQVPTYVEVSGAKQMVFAGRLGTANICQISVIHVKDA